jgi:hypothetical protein
MMVDEPDDCCDLVRYWKKLQQGCGCVFGSRFIKAGSVTAYPKIKLVLNRFANLFLKVLFNKLSCVFLAEQRVFFLLGCLRSSSKCPSRQADNAPVRPAIAGHPQRENKELRTAMPQARVMSAGKTGISLINTLSENNAWRLQLRCR